MGLLLLSQSSSGSVGDRKRLRKDGRRKEASGGIKEKDASGGSFARTTRKRPRTQDDDDWGNKLAPMG
jgi:hypothetical protein